MNNNSDAELFMRTIFRQAFLLGRRWRILTITLFLKNSSNPKRNKKQRITVS